MGNNIWIDLDNSPHVPLFKPIIEELKRRDVNYFVTSRRFAQIEELLKLWNIPHELIGKHGGKNKVKKVVNLFTRSNQLKKHFEERVHNAKSILAVSHGSRTQLVTARRMGIKSILMMDYEYTESKIFNYLSSILLIPRYIPDERLKSVGLNLSKVIRYNGFKEELYLNDFIPDKEFRRSIDVSDDQILVVIRPPSIAGNYHNSRSEELLIEGIKYFSDNKNTTVLIVNRTEKEKALILSKINNWSNVIFLEKPVNGLQLLFAADIAVSGGGTMNREAALLGTKTYSIFTGRRPYLDEYLQEMGKLKFLEKPNDFKTIPIIKNSKDVPNFKNNLVPEITDIIISQNS